ncbi:hypothetical protein LEMA_P043150.1 [Plenodomus lingam JN3]|uniref:Uncharacterized protein n=2 Tax=Leptosphaeria maculans TaxID=5022 RepID=E4ZPM9_LEPMJ|nr:hypothetical protein LEMA_P043150.1 [Plenodomus lingam JN3]CBX93414.1 hypothetical protein LEMA_P043150.1 [Plenodomus lingam JN3]
MPRPHLPFTPLHSNPSTLLGCVIDPVQFPLLALPTERLHLTMSASSSPSDRIQAYYENYPSCTLFIGGDTQDQSATTLEKDVEALHVRGSLVEATEEQKIQAFRRDFCNQPIMPVHPAEETAGGSITDQVAKDSKDSNASSAQLHDVDTGASSGGNVHAAAHKRNPGPVMADNLPTPESKEDLKKRAAELNK